MAAKTRAALKSAIAASIAANGSGAITGPVLRTILTDLADSLLTVGETGTDAITGLNAAIASIPDTVALGVTVAGHTVSIADNTDVLQTHQNAIQTLEAAAGGGSISQLTQGGTVRVRVDAQGVYIYAPVHANNVAALAAGMLNGQVYTNGTGGFSLVFGANSGGGSGVDQFFEFDFSPTTINPDWFGAGITLPDDGFSDIVTVVTGSTVTRETTIKPVGSTASMRCFTPAKTGATTPKAHVSREGWQAGPGSSFDVEWDMYLPSGFVHDSLFMLDLEIDGSSLGVPELVGNFFGFRLRTGAGRTFKLDREFSTATEPGDDTGRAYAIPLNVWKHYRVVYDVASTNGAITIFVDGVEEFRASNYQTIPSAAQLSSTFGIPVSVTPVHAMVQLGITANGSATNDELAYFANFKCSLTL